MNNLTNLLKKIAFPLALVTLTACGGSSDSVFEEDPPPLSQACVTSDVINSNINCGTLLLGLTDADGDFLTYNVKVSGFELTRADGTVVSVMPDSQTVDFVEYVELSELATAATIPVGVYNSGSITVDYSEADIQVEKDMEAVSANMVDENGDDLLSTTLELQFDQNNLLIVSPTRPAFLQLDFNLAASHTVDLDSDPVTVTTEPYIIGEVDPVLSKEFRVRGPLIRVSEDESFFRIAVRPFHRRNNDRFGGVNVQVDEDTSFEINGESFEGSEGLTQMASLDAGTPTVTFGEFVRADGEYTAITVMAGSSVPGADKDAARGVIVARDGNTLTVRGASLIRRDRDATFRDQVTVLISEDTKVFKPRRIDQAVTIDDLSVGQAVTILGDIQVDDPATTDVDANTVLDATAGAIRMRITAASGHVVSAESGLITMDLQALQGRAPDVYDFSGTGISNEFDADPDNYEVATDNLLVTLPTANDPVRVTGFVTPFGSAPADFGALNVINYAESRSQLVIDWPEGDDVMALSELTSESMTINVVNNGEGGTYKLIQGGIRTELTSLDGSVVVEPLGERGIYTLRTQTSIQAFSNFADYTAELQQKLDEGMSIDMMYSYGGFSNETLVFRALQIAVRLN